jgi:protease-4
MSSLASDKAAAVRMQASHGRFGFRAGASRRRWGAALVMAIGLGACAPAAAPKVGKELRVIRFDELPDESPQHGLFGNELNHRALIDRIAGLADDADVSGVFLHIGELSGAWARGADLRDALADVHKKGKPIHCHFETTDNLGYALLAESCDRISITPSGTLDLVGVAIETLYAHELLQNLGLDAQMLQQGRFKGAADPLTRDDMPKEVQETLGAIVDDLQARVVASIARGRKLSPERVQALIDQGPFTAEDARTGGLVDEIVFDDGARGAAKLAAKAERVVDEALKPGKPSIGFFDIVHALFSDESEEKPKGDRLVLAYLAGTIMRGAPSSYRGAQAEAFVHAMRGFATDPQVKAVVLRIDSPGGSALASDLMWQAVRKVQKRKPVIVSIGDMCASGGYYVASAGSEIMAQNESLVGSIGVVGGKVVASDLAERVGVHFAHLGRGKHAGWQSVTRPFTTEERALFEHHLRDTYDRFIDRIAEGRKLTRSQIEPYAEGRLMTARRAREGRLVDSEGGLRSAITHAREQARLGKDAQVQVWPEKPTWLDALGSLSGNAESESNSALLARVIGSRQGALFETLLSRDALSGAVLPYVLSAH